MNKKKIDFGWIIVAYGVLVMLLLHYGTIGSQAIFMNPMTADLGITKTKLTMASTYATVVSFFVTPWSGKMMNKKSLKKLLLIGLVGTSVTMILQGYVTHVYQYYAIMLVRTGFSAFALMTPFATLVARWFPKAQRSFATSIVFVGISLGGVVLSNPLTSLIESIGWRMTFRMYGLISLVLLAPLCIFCVRDFPDNYEELIQGEAPAEKAEKIDFASLLKNKKFLLLTLGMAGISFIGGSLYHMSSYVQSLGYSAAFGATIISSYNFVCMFSKMIMGKLFDKAGMAGGVIFGAVGTIGCYSLMTLSMFRSSTALLLVIALFYGIGNTCQSMTATSMVAGLFGVRNYSEIYTKLTTITMCVSAICNPAISMIFERTGSYLSCWILCTVLSVLSAVFLLWASREKKEK